MKALLVKCGICYEFFSPIAHSHCGYCGAMKVKTGRSVKYYNEVGREMARGVPYVYKPPTNELYEDYAIGEEMHVEVKRRYVANNRIKLNKVSNKPL